MPNKAVPIAHRRWEFAHLLHKIDNATSILSFKWATLELAVLGPKKSIRTLYYMGYVRKSRYSLREEKEMGRSYQEESERISSHLRGVEMAAGLRRRLSDLRAGTLCRPNQAH